MISRLRQILTISLLLLFSLENVANAAFDAKPEKYSSSEQVSAHKENLTLFSWILEENENEERDDDKVHRPLADALVTSIIFFEHRQTSEINFRVAPHPFLADNHQLLRLICRLRI
ncbi:MAG: hypothetical protein WDN75_11750 [Bacteroidota bacterium]